jgi:hypothetical protein
MEWKRLTPTEKIEWRRLIFREKLELGLRVQKN